MQPPELECAPSLDDADAATVVARCNALMQRLVFGSASTQGMRRRRPEPAGIADPDMVGDIVSEAPLDHDEELQGFTVAVEHEGETSPGVVVDVLSLELARASVAAPDRIRIEIVYCDDYPGEMLPGFDVPDGHRAVTLPSDPRRALWTDQLLEMVHADLGERSLAFDFEVETISARYEELLAAELVNPG